MNIPPLAIYAVSNGGKPVEAPVIEGENNARPPTFREERGNVGIMRSPVRASFLPGKSTAESQNARRY